MASSVVLRRRQPANRGAVRQVMDEVIAPEVAGVHIRVHDGQGDWSASAGTTMVGGDQLVPTNSWFRIGSIAKAALSSRPPNTA
ncbi:hypothetical protein [Nocardia asteroides]|uniref:hypothetical protein n=1 Tax=Nocardia asteroides TaxID=1824 RepID=UPI00341E086E